MNAKDVKRLGMALFEKAKQRAFVEENRGYLGGSEIGGCALKIYKKHTGAPVTDPRSLMSSRRLELGHIIERFVVDDYQWAVAQSDVLDLRYTLDEQRELIHEESGVKMHPDGTFFLHGNPVANFEVKSASEKSLKRMREQGLYPEYIAQSMLSMAKSGVPYTLFHLANALDLEDADVRVLEYNEDAGEKVRKRAVFLSNAIKHRVEPQAEPSVLCRFCLFKSGCPSSGKSMPVNHAQHDLQNMRLAKPSVEAVDAMREILALKKEIKQKTDKVDVLHERVKTELGNAPAFMPTGGVVAKYSQPKPKQVLSVEKMKAMLTPEQLATCYEEKVSSPSLRVQEVNNKVSVNNGSAVRVRVRRSAPTNLFANVG